MSTNNFNRQKLLAIVVPLTFANIGAASVTANLPPGAVVVGASLYTDIAFNGSSTVTGTITDGTLAFVSAQNVKTTGAETVAATNKYYPSGGTITFSIADAGSDSTAGSTVGVVLYAQVGKGDAIQE